MSSHHIVRDFQEPPLYIASLDGELEAITGELLEWSPYVMVDAAILDEWLMFGSKCDAIVGATNQSAEVEARFGPVHSIVGEGSKLDVITAHIKKQSDLLDISLRVVDNYSAEQALDVIQNSPHQLTLYTEEFMAFPLEGVLEKWMPEGRKLIIQGNDIRLTGEYQKDGKVLMTTGGFVKATTNKGVWLEYF